MRRRDVLKSAAGLAAWSGFWTGQSLAEDQPRTESNRISAPPARSGRESSPAAQTRKGDMLYRALGRTGETVSVLGVGGYHIGALDTENDSIKLIRTAIDRGITFMDNSWDYHEGKSEQWMGKALKDGYRNKVFLMTKLDGRTKDAAAKQINESLKRFDVDHIDLMQIHEIIRLEDPDLCFRDNGAIDALRDARKAGKIRFVGFTGHKDPIVHNRMIDTAAKHDFHFDTVQMPLNVLDANFRSFAQHTLPRLVEQNIGVLGMKSMASAAIVNAKIATPEECLTYAMTLPTSVVISGMDSVEKLEQNLRIVRDFKPLSAQAMKDLLARTATAASTGEHEGFKTSHHFDATAQYPQWLGLSGKPS